MLGFEDKTLSPMFYCDFLTEASKAWWKWLQKFLLNGRLVHTSYYFITLSVYITDMELGSYVYK